MCELQVVPADRLSLDASARVMVDAFASEGIHSYISDFALAGTRTALVRATRAEMDSCIDSGDHVLVAQLDGCVVGGVMFSRTARRPVQVRVVQALCWLSAAAPLAPSVRWKKLLRLHTATGLSRPLVGEHYTLSALAVHPQFQGRGIGTRLLAAVHATSERDPSVLEVYLYTGDLTNQRTYERACYQTIETRQAGALTVYHMFRMNGVRLMTLGPSG